MLLLHCSPVHPPWYARCIRTGGWFSICSAPVSIVSTGYRSHLLTTRAKVDRLANRDSVPMGQVIVERMIEMHTDEENPQRVYRDAHF